MPKTGDYAFQYPLGCTPGDMITAEQVEAIDKLQTLTVEQNKIATFPQITVPTDNTVVAIPGVYCSIDFVIVNGINQTEGEHYTIDDSDPVNVVINYIDAAGNPLSHGDVDEPCNIIVAFTCKVPLC